MPSGYTDSILKDATFEQFVWRCARGMGALIMMRDEPFDAPIPEKFEISTYHIHELEEAQKHLESLTGLHDDDWYKKWHEYIQSQEAERQKYKEKDDVTTLKYATMLEKVKAWTPPSTEHQGLKKFMIEQIEESMGFDVLGEEYYPKTLGFEDWKRKEIDSAQRDVVYHKKELEAERDRTEKRNAWIKALRESVPYPANGLVR